MTKEPNWGWYASTDEENYYCGPEATREDIIQAAVSDEIGLHALSDPQVFHIIEAWQATIDLADHFDAPNWVEAINDDLYDFGGQDGEPVVDLTEVAMSSLQRTVRDAIAKWQSDNNLRFCHWAFGGSRNGETITIPAQEPTE